MLLKFRQLAVASAILLGVSQAQAKPPTTDAERRAAMDTVVWRDNQVLTLPISGGVLHAPSGYGQLLGKDAATVSEVTNGVDAPSGTEAMLYDRKDKTIVYFRKLGSGYVKIDDWPTVDADAMLKEIKENTERNNALRKERGISAIHVQDWLQPPRLDLKNHSVRWTVDAVEEDGSSLVNSVALVLGRDGYERLTWIGTKEQFSDSVLKVGLDSFAFANGKRYEDYVEGDKIAEYGVAGLVASALGVKAASKLGILAFLAVFAKKGAALIIIPFVGIFAWIRKKLSRREA